MAMEVLANIDAMVLAVREAALVERFDVGQIAAIHRRLMERENERIAGQIRSRQNWIGGNDHNPCGADFVPPPPEEVGRLLSDLCATINDDLLPPLVQAALVHAQFETIHPFDDGNGRTGRALVHVVLRRRNPALRYIPPISVVLAAGKPRYIAGLTSFRADGVEEWVEYFAATTARAAHSAKDYLFAAEALRAEWREQLAALAHAPRSDAAAWAVIDILPGTPMITASAAAKATQRSIARVYEAIEQLVEAGVLIAQSSSRRNKTWEARGLLDLIQRMESGQTLDMSGP
jgi:Fic family protein